MTSPSRPSSFAALIGRLIVGRDADVVRGDLEEGFHRSIREGETIADARRHHLADTARTALTWWLHLRPLRGARLDDDHRRPQLNLYGMLAFSVRARARELGIRIAMGASRQAIYRLVLRQGLGVAAIGLAVGLVLALGVTRALGGFLFHIQPLDPTAFALAMAGLAIVGLVAAWWPARRAARVDPMLTMRGE
jgi:hypothetical protein